MVEVEKSKPITLKTILKRPKRENKEKVKVKTSEIEVNFRQGSNIYRYDIVDDFR